uniref:Uncharacterized GPI-anchored protein At5g19250-like n=1 Tax=Cicer arietinum TaxID=3827 RepID=A0A1S3DYG7_CICAR|nr:uncharacterized GPI-anchored protein At5g19250-like [Cicer arietinum]
MSKENKASGESRSPHPYIGARIYGGVMGSSCVDAAYFAEPTLKVSTHCANCFLHEDNGIEDTPCEKVSQYYPVSGPGGNQRISNMQKHIDKCGININTTTDGVILPVCVSKLEPTIVLSNYTHSDIYAKFLNNSKYTGVGLGSEDDWMVLVLTTNTTAGTFSAATTSMHVNVVVLMAFMLVIINYLH